VKVIIVVLFNDNYPMICYQDKRICRNYGRSFVGTRAELARRVISIDGILDVGIYRGNVNAETFLHFVDNTLAPNLLPFNGINPRSIVIMGTFTLTEIET